MLQQGLAVNDSSMSNLTSGISNEASISSTNNNINELMGTSTKHDTNQPPPPPKKRRNLPGNPDPDAEVMALSPGSLMATNRFVCEICNKGFQRDQNLQLHRRGHNLPWKLKQRSKTEVIKKKVYVCPEPSCVHHHPSRALGDLTGIKKHFSRKHGDKKWKCQKCSKRYAVQSDWKAHSKICGTREYRCDCGTLFSRRDSFITHRAFCDALAEESSRSIPQNHNINLLSNSQTAPNHNQFHGNFQHQMNNNIPVLKQETQTTFNLPPWLLSPDQLMFSSSSSSSSSRVQQSIQENPNHMMISSSSSSFPSLMSATALLQKASQMGVTMSSSSARMPNIQFSHVGAPGFCATSPTTTAGLPSREHLGTGFLHGALASFGDKLANVTPGCMDQQQHQQQILQDHHHHHHHVINMVGSSSSSLPSTSGAFDGSLANFEDSFDGMLMKSNINSFQENSLFMSARKEGGNGGGDGLTRDFLGLRAFPDRDFLNMAAFDQMGSSSYDHQQTQNQQPWQS